MKKFKKNNFLILLLFLIVILMSVGFSILSTTLNINGSSKIKSQTWDIHFANINVLNGSVEPLSTAHISNSDNTLIEYNIRLTNPGDYYEFTVDAVNSGSIDAKIETFAINGISNYESYLYYRVTYLDGTNVNVGDPLNANSSRTYKVRIEYKNDVTNLPEENINLNLRFSATYIQGHSNIQNIDFYTITGTVYDLDGQPLTNGTVELSNSIVSTITSNGQYTLLNVPVGSYEITVKDINNQIIKEDIFSLREGTFTSIAGNTITASNNNISINLLFNSGIELTASLPKYKFNIVNGANTLEYEIIRGGSQSIPVDVPENYEFINMSCNTNEDITHSNNSILVSNLMQNTTCQVTFTKICKPPSVELVYTNLSTNNITLTANYLDSNLDVIKYEFSKDNGITWIDNELNNIYSFSDLIPNTNYIFKVKVTNECNLTSENNVSVTSNEFTLPIISKYSQTPEDTNYATSEVLRINYSSNNVIVPKYYFKSTVSANLSSGTIVENCGTGTSPTNCVTSSVTSIPANTWFRTTSLNININYTSNGSLSAIVGDGVNESSIVTYTINNIDTTVPNVSIEESNIKSDRVTLTATCSDTSGVTKYEFSKDNGANWIDKGLVNIYTFTGLTMSTEYTFKTRCTNGANLTNVASVSATTKSLSAPTIAQYSQTPTTTTYATKRVIRITYNATNNAAPIYYFKSSVAATVASGVVVASCGTGTNPGTCTTSTVTSLAANTWYKTTATTVNVSYTKAGTLYAIISDNKNLTLTSTYTVTNMDTTAPTTSISASNIKTDRVTLTATCSDTSGITKYEFSKDNGTSWVNNTVNNAYTFTKLTDNTSYTFKTRCTNGADLINEDSTTITTSLLTAPTIAQYSQTPTTTTYATKRVIRITYNATNNAAPIYYFKSSVAATVASGVVVASCGTGTNPGTCTTSTVTSLAVNTWYKTTATTVNVSYTKAGTLYAIISDNQNLTTASTYVIANIDTTVPTASLAAGTLKTDRVTLTATCSDTSGITKYEFSKDNGTTWINKGTTKTYTFTKLTDNTSYTFKTRCTNGANLINVASAAATTKKLVAPVITQISQQPVGYPWAGNRTIRITYNTTNNANPSYYLTSSASAPVVTGTITEYCGTGTNPSGCTAVSNSTTDVGGAGVWWLTSDTIFELIYYQLGVLTARISDGTNIETAIYNVSKIDNSAAPAAPTVTYQVGTNECTWQNNYSIKLTASHASGIYGMELDVDNNGTVDHVVESTTFVPWSGFSTCQLRFRVISNTGLRSPWTSSYYSVNMN